MANPDYDAILSTTLENHRSQLVDNVFTARPLAFFLKQAGQIRMVGGGTKIVSPLVYGLNSTAKTYRMYDTLDTSPQDGISAAEFDWGQISVSITIAGLEEAVNSGEEQVIDLLEAKVMVAEESLTEVLDAMFLDNKATSQVEKDWNGIGHLIAQNSDPVGGIDPTTNAWWRSHIDAVSAPLTVKKMRTAYHTVSVGNDKPNLILTTQAGYEVYEEEMYGKLQYTDTKARDAGFTNIMYYSAPVVIDDNVPANHMYMLNTKYLRLVGHKDVWFKPTPFTRPSNQDARYAQILAYGNLTISNRARQAAITNFSIPN